MKRKRKKALLFEKSIILKNFINKILFTINQIFILFVKNKIKPPKKGANINLVNPYEYEK